MIYAWRTIAPDMLMLQAAGWLDSASGQCHTIVSSSKYGRTSAIAANLARKRKEGHAGASKIPFSEDCSLPITLFPPVVALSYSSKGVILFPHQVLLRATLRYCTGIGTPEKLVRAAALCLRHRRRRRFSAQLSLIGRERDDGGAREIRLVGAAAGNRRPRSEIPSWKNYCEHAGSEQQQQQAATSSSSSARECRGKILFSPPPLLLPSGRPAEGPWPLLQNMCRRSHTFVFSSSGPFHHASKTLRPVVGSDSGEKERGKSEGEKGPPAKMARRHICPHHRCTMPCFYR